MLHVRFSRRLTSDRPGMDMANSSSTHMRNFILTVGFLSYILIVSGDTLDNRKVVQCFSSCSGITVESEKVKSAFVTSCRVNRVSIIGENPVRIFAVKEKELCGKWFTFRTHGNRKWCCSRTFRGHPTELGKDTFECKFYTWKEIGGAHDNNASESHKLKHFIYFDYWYSRQSLLLWDSNAH